MTKLSQWPHLWHNLDRWSFSEVSSWCVRVADQCKSAWLEVDNQDPVLCHDSCFGNEDYDIDVEAYKIRRQRKIWKLQAVTWWLVRILRGYLF